MATGDSNISINVDDLLARLARAEGERDLYRSILDQLHYISVLAINTDPLAQVEFGNTFFCEFNGVTYEQAITMKAYEFASTPDDDIQKVNQAIGRVLAGEPPVLIHSYFRSRGAKHATWGLLIVQRLDRPNSHPYILFTTVALPELGNLLESTNITSDRIRAITTAANDAVILLDEAGRVTYWNLTAEKMFGIMAQHAIDRKLAEFVLPVRCKETFERAITVPKDLDKPSFGANVFESVAVRNDGAEFPVDISVAPVRLDNAQWGFVCFFRDVTERKKAEEAIRQSETTLRKMIEQSPISIAVVRMDGKLEYINRKMTEILGYLPEDVPDMDTWWLLAYPDETYRAETIELWTGLVKKTVVEGGEIEKREYQVTCKDKTNKTMAIFGTIVEGKVIVTFYDMTEIRKAEESLRKAKEALEEANKLKDQFVALVSHDLRSPLASIHNGLEIALSQVNGSIDTQCNTIIRRSLDNLKGLLVMIERLLDINRLKTGKIIPNKSFINAREFVGQVFHRLGSLADAKKIKLINDVPAGSRLFADNTLLFQTAQNLVGNAIKFCREGDTVTVSIHPESSNTLIVEDTGPGIDKNLIADLFKAEVHTSTLGTDGEKGYGLGLPLCHNIMKAHGGALRVESMNGKGARFYCELPPARPIALVVDDQRVVREEIAIYLKDMAVDVIEAENGKDALLKLARAWTQPHLVITDLTMPVMSGFKLLDTIKSQPGTQHIPVIVMTSSEDTVELRDDVFRRGAADFVRKPLLANDFVPRVRRFVGA